jgi:diacylglycerol kinase (ATP)
LNKKKQSDFLGLLQRRIVGGFTYSCQGLRSCFKHEEAFRVEVLTAAVLIPLALVIAETPVEQVLLIGSVVLVLVAELLNSAIEAVVDRIGEEHHELSGRAKDQGSAAVLVSMGVMLITWLMIGLG